MFFTLSPVVSYVFDRQSQKTLYFSPEQAEFVERLRINYLNKYVAMYGYAPDELLISPIGRHKKTVTRYKNTWITAYGGQFLLEGSPRALTFAYDAGLGAKNAQGFGLLLAASPK